MSLPRYVASRRVNCPAGYVRCTSGAFAITPASCATVAGLGGGCVRVGKASVSPPPCAWVSTARGRGEATYGGVAHEEQREAGIGLCEMLEPPLDVGELVVAAGLAVEGAGGAVLLVEGGPAEAAEVVGEEGYAALGPSVVDVIVARDVVAEAVDVEHDGLGGGGGPCARVELEAVVAGQPGLGVGEGGRHER